MSTSFNYTIPDTSNIQITNDTIVNNLLNDIKLNDISNTTHTTLDRSNALKNSQSINHLKQLSNFLEELEKLNKSLE